MGTDSLIDNRVVAWFSAEKYKAIDAVYCRVVEEHEDNLRFLDDFTKVTGIPVKTIINEKHQGSIYNVFLSRKFIKGPTGAPCTLELKKNMRKSYQQPNDIQVFGYTVEEQGRADRFIDSNNDVKEDFILITNKITKQDCYDRIKKLGIELPVMYKLGYSNNNCVGCVKGGMGYWNQIRQDFPSQFDKMARLERLLNHAINKDKQGPVFLDTLDPKRGNKTKDAPADCGFTCEMTQTEFVWDQTV